MLNNISIMRKLILLLTGCLILVASCNRDTKKSEKNYPEGVQGISLMGDTLYTVSPNDRVLENYFKAKTEYENNISDPDKLVWLGRWMAYTGDYRRAIDIYTDGIEKFPDDARFYRHRGHRYISLREFELAIADFKKAAKMVKGKEEMVEPDGMPNAMNIPISSLQSNIWYHLGLAYYLENDLRKAEKTYRIAVETSTNDDKLVSTTHWLYMILRLQNKDEEAKEVLKDINPELKVIENTAYHNLCLFYKGVLPMEKITGDSFSDIMNDAVLYGIANWFFYNDQLDKSREVYERILSKDGWASFGYIAAEADYFRNQDQF